MTTSTTSDQPPTADKTQPIVRRLPSKVIQIQAASQPGDFNCGPHIQLFSLCDDGSVWVQYHSSGSSNVPTNGMWHQLHESHEAGHPADQYQVSPLD